MPAQLPDPQLGNVVSEWSVGWLQRTLLCLCLVLLGGVLLGIGISAESTLLTVVAGPLTLILVVLLLVQQAALKVVLYTHGIERRGLLGKQRLAWDQLQSVTLNIIDPASTAAVGGGVLVVLIVRAFTPKNLKPQAVVLLGKDGKKLTLHKYLKGYDTLLESLLPYLTERLIAGVHQDLNRGITVGFGKRLALDPAAGVVFTGLFGKKQVLPLAQVESVGTERALLIIRKHGQKKPWQRVAARSVPNLTVFQRVLGQASGAPLAPPQPDTWSWSR